MQVICPPEKINTKGALSVRTFFLVLFSSLLISILQLHNQLHYKCLQNLQDIWNLQKFNIWYKVRLNYRDRKLEEDLKDLVTSTWAWFVQIESTSFIKYFKFHVSKMRYLSNKEESFLYANFFLFFLLGFSFTTIHESQDCRGSGRASL